MDTEKPAMTLERITELHDKGPWGIKPRTRDGWAEWQRLCKLAERALAAPPEYEIISEDESHFIKEAAPPVIGDDSSAGDAARLADDSNDEESPTREAFAWLYQFAGASNAPGWLLDNLSALACGKSAPHGWQYPAMPTPPKLTRKQAATIWNSYPFHAFIERLRALGIEVDAPPEGK